MYKMIVQGEIRSLGWREGASGILTGDINGLFQGYRLARHGASLSSVHVLEAENGTVTLTLHQEAHIRHPLPPRPAEHPFKDGRDPFAGVDLVAPRLPDLPRATQTGSSRGNMTTTATLKIDPQLSTGIFAGAQGELEITLAESSVNGWMEIETDQGRINLHYRERMEGARVINRLWIDGEKSTGLYEGAQGELEFQVSIYPPNFAKGTYSGTLWIKDQVIASYSVKSEK